MDHLKNESTMIALKTIDDSHEDTWHLRRSIKKKHSKQTISEIVRVFSLTIL